MRPRPHLHKRHRARQTERRASEYRGHCNWLEPSHLGVDERSLIKKGASGAGKICRRASASKITPNATRRRPVRGAKTPPETGHSRPTWPLRPGVLGSPQPGGAGAGQWAPFRGRFCFRLPIYWVGRRRRTGSKVCWARPGRKPYPRPRAGGCVPGRSRAELSRPPYRPEGSRKLRRSGPQTPTIRLQSDSPITRRH